MPRKNVAIPLQVLKLLKVFCGELKSILKENFVALYVFGSLGMGDFNEKCSDVDFLVLTEPA